MSLEQIRVLTSHLEEQHFLPGEVIMYEGEFSQELYILVSGRVRIAKDYRGPHEQTLALLTQGDFFGEMAMLDGHGRSADATVIGDARLAKLTREDFLSFINSDPRITLEMLTALTRRLRRTDDLLRHRVSRNVNEEEAARLTLADRAADKIAEFGGSWKFIAFSVGFFLSWMALNTWLLFDKGFDPYPYVFLNLVLGIIVSLQAPIIIMSQNRQAEKDRLRSNLDYQLNLKNELLLSDIIHRLDELAKKMRE